MAIDPPGHGRLGGHYLHTRCPYVRHKNNNALQRYRRGQENKILATTDTMRENSDHLLAGAWWVIFFDYLYY